MLSFLIPSISQTSCIRCESKLLPLSDRRASGTPTSGITSSASSRAMHTAFWSGTEKTKGYLETKSWNTTTCLFPASVLGRSITSTPIIYRYRVKCGLVHLTRRIHNGTLWTGCTVFDNISIHLLRSPLASQCFVYRQSMEWLSSLGKPTYKPTIVRCYPEELPHFSHFEGQGTLALPLHDLDWDGCHLV